MKQPTSANYQVNKAARVKPWATRDPVNPSSPTGPRQGTPPPAAPPAACGGDACHVAPPAWWHPGGRAPLPPSGEGVAEARRGPAAAPATRGPNSRVTI